MDAVGGQDLAREAVESRLRRVAREGGHEPVGRVTIKWYEGDPGDGSAPREVIEPDPDRRWARASVEVELHAAREKHVAITCPQCGGFPETTADGGLRCPRCD
jgi:hypothetical protein